jgi:nitrate reductase delta subunit
MLTFRVLSVLLNYPTPELRAEVSQAERIVRGEGVLAGMHLESVCAFLQRIRLTPQLEAESAYIDAFDRGRSTSLYLFEHIHGESRDRGQAMVQLLMRYRMHGLDVGSRELPDFLPLFLEFLSTCRPADARRYLQEVVDIITLIGQRLRNRETPYAYLLEAIASLAATGRTEEIIASGESNDLRDDLPAALDAAWEEAPVTFDGAAIDTAQSQVHAAVLSGRKLT